MFSRTPKQSAASDHAHAGRSIMLSGVEVSEKDAEALVDLLLHSPARLLDAASDDEHAAAAVIARGLERGTAIDLRPDERLAILGVLKRATGSLADVRTSLASRANDPRLGS